MTSAGPDSRLPATRPRTGRLVRQVWWTSVPIWSIGFLSPVPFLFYAVGQRTRRAWGWFAGYLAATVAMIVALGAFPSGSGGNAAVGGFIVALAGCAAVHSFFLFRPEAGPGAPGAPGAPLAGRAASVRQLNQAAVIQARDRIERRKEARHLIATNPALARDLMIGRPDLTRAYDDGGLVDVNHVPGAVLATGLGLAPGEVTDVLAARDKLGRFTSADELCAYTDLPPARVDELRDLMIFT
jgi:DNA uptake protein ComE-like DNA-binding protein